MHLMSATSLGMGQNVPFKIVWFQHVLRTFNEGCIPKRPESVVPWQFSLANSKRLPGKVPWLQGLGPVVTFQVFPATPTQKTGYNGWNPRNGETHII